MMGYCPRCDRLVHIKMLRREYGFTPRYWPLPHEKPEGNGQCPGQKI